MSICLAGEPSEVAETTHADMLDIFEMPMDAKIITTIEELQRLYFLAYDNATAEMEQDAIIRGDIV